MSAGFKIYTSITFDVKKKKCYNINIGQAVSEKNFKKFKSVFMTIKNR